MNEKEMIEWINSANYTELLRKWRFAPPGSPFFIGKVGDHFKKVITVKKAEVGPAAHTAASKHIGW